VFMAKLLYCNILITVSSYISRRKQNANIYRIRSSRNKVCKTNVQHDRGRWMLAGRSDLIH
jgi:hypothetical protein